MMEGTVSAPRRGAKFVLSSYRVIRATRCMWKSGGSTRRKRWRWSRVRSPSQTKQGLSEDPFLTGPETAVRFARTVARGESIKIFRGLIALFKNDSGGPGGLLGTFDDMEGAWMVQAH